MGGINKEKRSSSTSPCSHLRAAYHDCFNRWYSEKFLKGQWDKEECVSEWQKYRSCLSQHLEDKHLSRFLEAEAVHYSLDQDESSRPFGASGVSQSKVNKTDKRHGWKWTEQMDEILIDAFVSQNNIGNRVNGTFTTTAYNNIVNELIERLGQEFNKQLVKNRMKTIKKNFNECYDLFKGEMNGFAWNRVTKMWDAEPEIWKELIKAKPEVKKWMNTPLPNYEKLAKLFEKDKATSEGAEIVSKKAKRGENEMQIGEKMEAGGDGRTIIEDVNHMMANDDVFLEIFEGTHDMHDRSQPATPREIASTAATKSTTSSHSKKRIASSSIDYSGLEDSIREVALAINKGNEILQKRNEILERSRSRVYMEGDVFDELVRLGIDSELLYRAYSFLVEKSGRMRAFFGCPAERRMGYLMMMLNSAGDS